jgi:hypothetical protein
MTDTNNTTPPLLSSPAPNLVFSRPQIGEPVLIAADKAAIVATSRFLDAETCEDFDFFDAAANGGAWDVTVRDPQTDDERAACAALLAQETARIEQVRTLERAERQRRDLAGRIQEAGTFPEKAEPAGHKITNRQNIYGGGDWFVVDPDAIWYVRNNGHDGDDWSLNNLATGGAGAMAWRIDSTPEDLAQLAAIEAVLDPDAVAARSPDIGVTAYQRHLAPVVNAAIWGEPAGKPEPPPGIAWVKLGGAEGQGAVFAGVDSEHAWLAVRAYDCSDSSLYERYGSIHAFLGGQYAIAFRYPLTEARIHEVQSRRAAWCTDELVQAAHNAAAAHEAAMDRYRAYVAEHDKLKPSWDPNFSLEQQRAYTQAGNAHREEEHQQYLRLEREGKDAADRCFDRIDLHRGRYRLPNREGWASNAREALHHCSCFGLDIAAVEFEPGVELLYANGESHYTGHPWALWSDGHHTLGECNGTRNSTGFDAGSTPVSEAASRLLYRLIGAEEAKAWLAAGDYHSTIKYPETAKAILKVLGVMPERRDETVLMEPGDEALVFRLHLPPRWQRPPEDRKGSLGVHFLAQHSEIGILNRTK